MNPQDSWVDKEGYLEQAKKLAKAFDKNFNKYAENCPENVVKHGGPNLEWKK